ncbi:hypothetical protein BDZ91DRAFT_782172 [Kalaharituber pfeilii]|nr:hypothetical protein BDZ91DRAFT_782172 [Kalaharituber pfeilii]
MADPMFSSQAGFTDQEVIYELGRRTNCYFPECPSPRSPVPPQYPGSSTPMEHTEGKFPSSSHSFGGHLQHQLPEPVYLPRSLSSFAPEMASPRPRPAPLQFPIPILESASPQEGPEAVAPTWVSGMIPILPQHAQHNAVPNYFPPVGHNLQSSYNQPSSPSFPDPSSEHAKFPHIQTFSPAWPPQVSHSAAPPAPPANNEKNKIRKMRRFTFILIGIIVFLIIVGAVVGGVLGGVVLKNRNKR